MAYKVVSLGNQPQQQEQESLPAKLLRNVVSGGEALAEGALFWGGIPGTVAQLAGLPKGLPTASGVTQGVREIAEKVLPENYLKPRGSVEETARRFASNVGTALPLAVFTGGLSLVPAAAGAIGAQVGKEVGGEGWPEIIGSLAGNFGADFIRKGGQGFIKAARSKGEKLQEKLYSEAKPIAEKLAVPTKGLRNKLDKIVKDAEDVLTPAELEQFHKDFRPIDKVLSGKTTTLERVWNEKKRINRAFDKIYDKQPRRIYTETKNALVDELGDYAKKHPEFGQPFARAEDLTRGLNAMSTLRKAAESSTDIGQILSKEGSALPKIILGGLATGAAKGLISPVAAAATVPLAYGTRSLLRGYDFFRNSAEGRKLVTKGLGEAALGDVTGLAQTIRLMDKKFTQETKKKDKGYKVVSLGNPEGQPQEQ